MSSIGRCIFQLGKNIINQQQRMITTTPVNRLKELIEKKEGDTLILEAKIYTDKRDERLLKIDNGACPLCSLGIEVKHTDVLILSQFVKSDGGMLPRRLTKLCKTQQKRVSTMVTMAHRAGLMGKLKPKNCHMDPTKRQNEKAFNTYYDEDTIRAKYRKPIYQH